MSALKLPFLLFFAKQHSTIFTTIAITRAPRSRKQASSSGDQNFVVVFVGSGEALKENKQIQRY